MKSTTGWYNVHSCIDCDAVLNENKRMYSGGRCPECGFKGENSGTIVDTKERAIRFFRTAPWWKVWGVQGVYQSKDEIEDNERQECYKENLCGIPTCFSNGHYLCEDCGDLCPDNEAGIRAHPANMYEGYQELLKEHKDLKEAAEIIHSQKMKIAGLETDLDGAKDVISEAEAIKNEVLEIIKAEGFELTEDEGLTHPILDNLWEEPDSDGVGAALKRIVKEDTALENDRDALKAFVSKTRAQWIHSVHGDEGVKLTPEMPDYRKK